VSGRSRCCPRTSPRHGLTRLLDAGFDAVSLGVQSFPRCCATCGARRRSRRTATVAVPSPVPLRRRRPAVRHRVRPPEVLLTDLGRCFAMGVDQVSTYPLMRFGYTPFGKRRHQPQPRTPAAAGGERPGDAATATSGGRSGRSTAWTGRRTRRSPARLPRVGAGAATSAGTWFLVDHFGLAPYLAAVAAGRLPIARLARPSHPPRPGRTGSFWQLYTGTACPTGFVAAGPGGQHPAGCRLRRGTGGGLARADDGRAPPDRPRLRPLPRPRARGHLPPDRAAVGGADGRARGPAGPSAASRRLSTGRRRRR
jgi:hypothetical protein